MAGSADVEWRYFAKMRKTIALKCVDDLEDDVADSGCLVDRHLHFNITCFRGFLHRCKFHGFKHNTGDCLKRTWRWICGTH